MPRVACPGCTATAGKGPPAPQLRKPQLAQFLLLCDLSQAKLSLKQPKKQLLISKLTAPVPALQLDTVLLLKTPLKEPGPQGISAVEILISLQIT